MKICKIIDESMAQREIGYLFYYENEESFIIELSKALSFDEASIFFAPFIERGELTLNSKWSEHWVNQRIVPTDRQNLGQILRDNKLKDYNRYRLLMLGHGRCAQDDYAVVKVDAGELPAWVQERMKKRIEFCAAISSGRVVAIFRDGTIRIFEVEQFGLGEANGDADRGDRAKGDAAKEHATSAEFVGETLRLAPCGVAINVGRSASISAREIYENTKQLPLRREDLRTLMSQYIVDTKEVCEELGCSRQYVHQLTQNDELLAFKESSKTTLYTKSDVKRMQEQ